MGRMLDTFKHGETRKPMLTVGKPADEAPVQDCVVDWEIGAEVPYVEVGGADKKVELSPGLMKHPAQVMPQPPHLPVEVAKPSVVKLTETKPMAVAFEPWTGIAASNVSPEIITYHQPDHATSKEYAGLLETMCGNLKTDGSRVLLLVGMKPHVGTSTVLLNLAVSAAQKKNLRVALLDMNTAHPVLASRLGCGMSVGLGEVLAGSLALEQALAKTPIANLYLLPAGAPTKRLTSEALTWLLASLRERYDLIFFDGSTIEDAAALTVQVPHTDGVYLVLPQNETKSLSKGIAHNISRLGGRLCGLIHTHFEM